MTDYVCRRFPNCAVEILALEAENGAFYEACSNYEEICTWLATQEHQSVARNPDELDQAREIKRDLEDEILNLLENQRDINR